MITTRPPCRLERVMGTAVLFDLGDASVDDDAVDEALEYLHWVDATFSTFRADSEISRLREGTLAAADALPEVQAVLAMCDELRSATRGAFDHRAGTSLDPAGYVKGWAVEGAAAILAAAGVLRFAISAGGDLVARGRPPGADHWRIGIRDPADDRAIVGTVALRNAAMATSGRYERGDHIWTGSAGSAPSSVTVVGPHLGIADALATALMACGLEECGWLGDFTGYGLVAVTPDRRILRSPGVAFTPPA